MKDNESLKLKLFKILLNPNVIVEDYSIERQIINDPNYLFTNYFCDTPIKKDTGRRFIKLTIFQKL